jgi:hypothetical protein
MAEDLGSTNITDLINEDDTDMNDEMVSKILNELDNTEPSNENNNINTNIDTTFEQEISNHFPQTRDPTLDFRDPNFNNNINLESENTVNKINSIIEDSNGLAVSSISSIINKLKIPIIVFILSIVFNNPMLTEMLHNLLFNIIKNKNISSYISLILRTIFISIILFLLNFFNLI